MKARPGGEDSVDGNEDDHDGQAGERGHAQVPEQEVERQRNRQRTWPGTNVKNFKNIFIGEDIGYFKTFYSDIMILTLIFKKKVKNAFWYLQLFYGRWSWFSKAV
jgi:hypothetical protein